VFQNVWLFEAGSGRLVSAQLYADTAAVGSSAGVCDTYVGVPRLGWL
jgi:hypothetical protein